MTPVVIGGATLYNADCMGYLATCADKSFALAIVDPPYGIGQDGGTCRSKFVKQKNGARIFCTDGGYEQKDWDRSTPSLEYFAELVRVSKNQIIWGINYLPVLLRGGRIVWDKVKDKSDYSKAEIAYCSMHESVQMVRYMWNGMMQGDSIGSVLQQGDKSKNEARIHPTQKPIKLYEWLLTAYAKPGERILDTHLGSGSSAIAANTLGFEFVGIELDADYFAAACNRIESSLSQGQLFAPEPMKQEQASFAEMP